MAEIKISNNNQNQIISKKRKTTEINTTETKIESCSKRTKFSKKRTEILEKKFKILRSNESIKALPDKDYEKKLLSSPELVIKLARKVTANTRIYTFNYSIINKLSARFSILTGKTPSMIKDIDILQLTEEANFCTEKQYIQLRIKELNKQNEKIHRRNKLLKERIELLKSI